jgi:GT2 family glycosyltransferase
MDVDVVIVNYRMGADCVRAVESVAGELGADRVWVVDNSQDPVESRFLKERLPTGSRLVVAPANIGFGAACNLVYGRTRAEGFLLLNPDAYFQPGSVRLLVRHLASHPRAGAVSPRASLDPDGIVRMPDLLVPEWWHELMAEPEVRASWGFLRRRARCWRARHIPGWVSESPCRVDGIPGGHVLLRRKAVDASGGLFDPAFFMYYEDADLARRMAATGYESWVVPASRAVHLACGTRHPEPGFKGRMELESGRRYLAKHFGSNWRLRLWSAWSSLYQRRASVKPYERADLEAGVDVPLEWRDDWVVEFSTHPLLMPACTWRGHGARACLPAGVVKDMPVDAGYFRLGSARDFRQVGKVFRWIRRSPEAP